MNFFLNRHERRTGFDLNGDGYIGGEGLSSRFERYTGIDWNGDGWIGRPHDVYYGRYGGFSPYGGNHIHRGFPYGY